LDEVGGGGGGGGGAVVTTQGLTQSNRNEYQEYILGGKGSRCIGLTTLPLHVLIALKYGSLNLQDSLGPVQGLLCHCIRQVNLNMM